MSPIYATFFIILCFFSVSTLASERAKAPAEIKKTEEEIRQRMVQISKELGATCTDCHLVKNWKDDSKEYFKVSKEHMKLVDILRANGMNKNAQNKNTEASCYMCHRGSLKYRAQLPEKAE